MKDGVLAVWGRPAHLLTKEELIQALEYARTLLEAGKRMYEAPPYIPPAIFGPSTK